VVVPIAVPGPGTGGGAAVGPWAAGGLAGVPGPVAGGPAGAPARAATGGTPTLGRAAVPFASPRRRSAALPWLSLMFVVVIVPAVLRLTRAMRRSR
jgi:hypothetical protein